MFKRQLFVITVAASLLFLGSRDIRAQSDIPKFEVGAQFSTVGIADGRSFGGRDEAGFGGRLTYNLSRYFALEAEVNYFPRDYNFITTDFTGGRVVQGLFGLKAGIRKEKFGIFGKVRPGFQSSERAARPRFLNGDGPDPRDRFGFEFFRATQRTLDVGGVVEYYPTRRTILRFDVGDTITRFPNIEFFCFPGGVFCPQDVYTHRLQLSAGFGFRF